MPSTLTAPAAEFEAPRRKTWTREECDLLADRVDLRRYELIDGELIEKMGKKHPHMLAVMVLVEWLRSVFPSRMVGQEISIEVRPEDNPASEPEPDAVVLSQHLGELTPRPKPADIRLLVEVADATLFFDLNQKAALYARAGIVEYWVLDLNGRRLIVHRRPEAGAYREVMAYAEQESVAPLAAPGAGLVVVNLL